MNEFDRLPKEEIISSKAYLELIDDTDLLGKLRPFMATVLGITDYLKLDKEHTAILEAGSNPVGDFDCGLMSPNVSYFFSNHQLREYYGFDAFMDKAYIPWIKEQIEANQEKCRYKIGKEQMLENMVNQQIFSYDSFMQKKDEIQQEGKKPILISSNVFGSHIRPNDRNINYDFWNFENTLQIHRFCLFDFVKMEADDIEYKIVFNMCFDEAKHDRNMTRQKIKEHFNVETEEKRASFLNQKLQEKYKTIHKYSIFDCPFEEGFSIAVFNGLKMGF